jgi:DNA primase
MSGITIRDFVEKYLTVSNESSEEYAVFCPFHDNSNTAAMYINKSTGLFICHNPHCGRSGRFATLVKELGDGTYEVEDTSTYQDVVDFWGIEPEKEVEMSLGNVEIDYDSDEVRHLDYLIERGFTIETLKHFEIGYSKKRNRISIPVRDINYKVVGIIGRALDKDAFAKYLYSAGFKRKQHVFNLQNAKYYETAIITEGSLDAIKVHQAGFPNVVATLGAQLSSEQASLINKHFDELVIFSDNDEAGDALKSAIMDRCQRKGMRIVVYPEGFKDPGEMSEEQIKQCIEEATDSFNYLLAKIA